MVLIRIFLTGIDKSSYLAYEEGKVVSCGVEEKHSYHDNVLINVVPAEIEFTIEGVNGKRGTLYQQRSKQ